MIMIHNCVIKIQNSLVDIPVAVDAIIWFLVIPTDFHPKDGLVRNLDFLTEDCYLMCFH
jgi:hypothetical protein